MNEWYTLPKGEYSDTFLKSLAIAVHTKKVTPEELTFFFEKNWTQLEIAKELYKRFKPNE